MTRNDLIDLVVDYAIIILEADDANPDVGMGIGPLSAVFSAEKKVFEEAVRWNSLAALALDFEDIRTEVINNVNRRRRSF